MIRIKTDAAVNEKNKSAGIGIVIVNDDLYKQLAIPFPYEQNLNNHTLEFQAVIQALEWLLENDLTQEMVFIETDSKVVVQVVEKEQTKNEAYLSLLNEILTLREKFSIVTIQWIPEKENKGADNLAKQALKKT